MSSWQRAFVLHRYPYSETSLLIDFFVESRGQLTLVAKGARRKQTSQKGILQPFTPLIIQYSGSGQVKTLCHVEAISLALPLARAALYSAFYVNELLQRVLQPEMETSQLFADYLECLQVLACSERAFEPALRRFELSLLDNLGYKLDRQNCDSSGLFLDDAKTYLYKPEQGFFETAQRNEHGFTGAQLRAFACRNFSDPVTLRAAKRFTRHALLPYVGSKPFKSRELFRRVSIHHPIRRDNH